MAQVKSPEHGRARVESGSVTVRGSWKAAYSNLSGSFTADETVTFAPSGATGRFEKIDATASEVFFVVTGGTPADGDTMSGATASCDLTSPAKETHWLQQPKDALDDGQPIAFALQGGSGLQRPIASVDADDQLTLSDPWRGSTAIGQSYTIALDYTPNVGLARIARGDRNTAGIVTRDMDRLDELLAPVLGAIASGDFDGVIVRRQTNQSIPNNTSTIVTWDDVIADSRSSDPGVTAGWFDPAQPDRIAIPSDVSYVIQLASIHWAASGAGIRDFLAGAVGGSGNHLANGLEARDRRNATSSGVTIQGAVALAIGQPTNTAIEMRVFQDSGGALNLLGGGDTISTYLVVLAYRRAVAQAAATLIADPTGYTAMTLGSKVEQAPSMETQGYSSFLSEVSCRGTVRVADPTGAPLAPGDLVALLPQGSRPNGHRIFWSGPERLDVFSNGRIEYQGDPPGGSFGGYLSLDVIRFRAEA